MFIWHLKVTFIMFKLKQHKCKKNIYLTMKTEMDMTVQRISNREC